jgi:hypothetical protein
VAVVCRTQKREEFIIADMVSIRQYRFSTYLQSESPFRVCRPMTGQDHILDRMVDKAETVLDDMDA